MRAIKTFIDSADPMYIYHPGDVFPRAGIAPAGEHIQRLIADGLIEDDGKAEQTQAEKPKRKRKGE